MIAPQVVLAERLQPSPTGITLDPVVSSAIAATCAPSMPVAFSASFVAAASAAIWSLCDCVA
jgi:hypothetical protein